MLLVSFGAISIFAFTQRLVAGPEFGATPSVETWIVIPWTPTAAEAETVASPVVGELTVKVDWPPAFVGQVVTSLTNVAIAPSVLTIGSCTVQLAAATKPLLVPLSFSIVTVNVCWKPTSFTSFCAIEIFASTHRLVAGPEFGATPSVETGTEIPCTPTFDEAETVARPVVGELTV